MPDGRPLEREELYILGHPIGHSKSPAMYNAAYERFGLPWSYGPMDCGTAEQAQAFLREGAFLSSNVTTPYKPLAYEACARLDPSALLARGANLLIREEGGLRGLNVDGLGCIAYLEREGVSFEEGSVVVCGTGPTSRAIMHAAAEAGASQVTLLGRDAARAQAVLADYEACARGIVQDGPSEQAASLQEVLDGVVLRAGSYAEGARAIEEADAILDATPLGMAPGDSAPFDTALLSSGQVVFDVVYGHGQTALMAQALERGCACYDGRGMLVAQAVASFQLVLASQGVPEPAGFEELFALMAQAAFGDALAGA